MMHNEHIPIKNIYYMLAYAFKYLRLMDYKNLDTEKFGDKIENMYAVILGMVIGRQIKQGLYREYIVQNENLPTLRGKINMPGTISNRVANRQQLSCEFAELSENNIYNRILKTAVRLLIKSNKVDKEYKKLLTLKPHILRNRSTPSASNNSCVFF